MFGNKELWKNHNTCLQNTFFVLAFTLLPLLFGILSNILFTKYNGLSDYYLKGEFFLYSVSLMSSTYISYNSVKNNKNNFEGWINKLLLVTLVLVSACYAFIISSSTNPRPEIVKTLSFSGFFLAIPLFYYSQFVINKKSLDVGKFRKDEQNNIESKLS